MNPQFSVQNVMNGTYGRIWWNGQLWAECKTFSADITMTETKVDIAGEGAEFQKQTGWQGSGTITIHKVFSRVQTDMATGIRTGQYPRFQLVGRLDDPDALGQQRVAIQDITVDKFVLLAFDQKKAEDEQISFKFSSYRLLDTVPNPA